MINANMLPTHPTAHINAVNPDRLLLDVVSRVKIPELREFFIEVLNEPEIHQTLTVPSMMSMTSMSASSITCTYPVHALRRAGELAAYWCACGSEEHDVLFIATVLQGTQTLLVPIVQGGSTVEDVMFTLIRKPLHRLDDQAPRCSRLLRLSLGWGCADEIDDFYVPRLQMAIRRALTQVAFGASTTSPLSRRHNCTPRWSSTKVTRQCQA